MTKRITILGSTGSIGVSTLDLLAETRASGAADVQVVALTAGRNVARLAEQATAWRPAVAVIADPALLPELRDRLAGAGVAAAAGDDAVAEAAGRPADWVMAAIVGVAGLRPTLAAARTGAVIALANKESLVCAGPALLSIAAEAGGRVIPVDSEHSAIFQVLETANAARVRRLVLTASGGPFRTLSLEAMGRMTPAQAVAHPNWSMGAKISVDSATMMNKGLETIEASYLFATPEDRIDVLIHPQSIIHSMVEYADGSTLAQLGPPDMRSPIACALAWPQRMPFDAPRLDLAKIGALTFEAPDPARFPALRLSREALRRGGGAPATMNAANETAVEAFLAGHVGFLDIAAIVEETMRRMDGEADMGGRNDPVEGSLAVDAAARRIARAVMAERA